MKEKAISYPLYQVEIAGHRLNFHGASLNMTQEIYINRETLNDDYLPPLGYPRGPVAENRNSNGAGTLV